MSTPFTYELLEISWMLDYEFPTSSRSAVHDDHTMGDPAPSAATTPQIEYDADGIPMGQSIEEIRIREKLIDVFFRNWVEEHPEKCILNDSLNDRINVRIISIIEAKQHGAKSYKSTLAVMRLDEVLRHAIKLGEVPTKPGNKNQASFERMLLLSYHCEGIGTVKLTVGVRRSNREKVQYGISVMRPGEDIVVADTDIKERKGKKKAPHRK